MSHAPLDRAMLDRLYRYCYSLTGQEQAAFDLLHGSVEQYYAQKGGRPVEQPVAWLRRVIRNRFIDDRRRAQRRPEVALEAIEGGVLEGDVELLEDQMIAAIDMETVWQAIAPHEREVLHLWAIEGMTAREIGEATDTPRNTILSRIHRLRARLQARFGVRSRAGGER